MMRIRTQLRRNSDTSWCATYIRIRVHVQSLPASRVVIDEQSRSHSVVLLIGRHHVTLRRRWVSHGSWDGVEHAHARAILWIKFLQFHILVLRKNWSKSARASVSRRRRRRRDRGVVLQIRCRRGFTTQCERASTRVVTSGEKVFFAKIEPVQGYIEMEYVSLRRANASHKILQLPIWINKYVIQIRMCVALIKKIIYLVIWSHGKYLYC